MWPPLPVSRISSASAAPVTGPSRSPTWPTSMVGSQCRQKIRLTPSSAPSSISRVAPPGMTSSAGWNSSRTRPGSSPAACTSASARPAPSRAVVWTSCPQAWATPATLLCHGSSVRVVDREGVEVGPQRDPRAVAVAEVGDQPGVAGAGEPPADLRRGGGSTRSVVRRSCHGQLGVGVQVAAQVEQLVGVLVDHRLDESRARLPLDMSRTRLPVGRAGSGPGSGVDCDSLVVRREDPVGGGDRRQLAARAPAARTSPRTRRTGSERRSRCSSSSRTSAQVKSSCWWARFSASPSAPRRSRWSSTCSQTSSTPAPVSPEQVTTAGAALAAVHHPQRAGQLAGGRPRLGSRRAADRRPC